MQHKEVYLDLVAGNVGELAARLALAKKSFAKQKTWVKVEHLCELEQVRDHCTELQRRVEELEEARMYNWSRTTLLSRLPGISPWMRLTRSCADCSNALIS